jgi:small subunit ribosomal protein S20
MAVVHKSTIKRARQAEKRQQRNRQILSAVRTAVKKVLTAVDQKAPDAHALLREASSALHKAAAKGVIKRNTASRRVSRLAAKINALVSRT